MAGATEAKRGEELVQEYRRNFRDRLTKTGNPDAKNWLHERLKLLDRWEANFRGMREEIAGRGGRRTLPRSKPVEGNAAP